MRGNLSTSIFNPGDPPADPAQLQRWLRDMTAQLSAALGVLAAGHLDEQYKEPVKARNGDWAYADGTSWNPGGGKGLYLYNGTVWTLIKSIP